MIASAFHPASEAPYSFEEPWAIAVRKIGRNEACPCGSGTKFKRCHDRFGTCYAPDQLGPAAMLEALRAPERIRQDQQGLGRPIISAEVAGQKVVAVGNRLHWSAGWKTSPDFLGAYLKDKLGRDWRKAELAKRSTSGIR